MNASQFLSIVEIRTKIISVSSFLIGTFHAIEAAGSFDPLLFVLMAAAVLLVDMGTTGFNTYFDFRSGVDSEVYNVEGDKVLVHQGVTPALALGVSVAMYALALVPGAILGLLVGWPVVAVGAACMAVGFAYSGTAMAISRTPLGELAAGGAMGLVLVPLSFYVQAGWIGLESFLVAVPSGLLIASILTTNNTCDIEGDRAAGRRTVSILIGRSRAGWLIYLLGAAAFAWALGLVATGLLPRAGWAFLPLAAAFAVLRYRAMHRRGYGHATKGASMGAISQVTLAYTAAMLLTLAGGW